MTHDYQSWVILKIPLSLGTNNEFAIFHMTWKITIPCLKVISIVAPFLPVPPGSLIRGLGKHCCFSPVPVQKIGVNSYWPLAMSILFTSYLPSCKMNKYARALKGATKIVFKLLWQHLIISIISVLSVSVIPQEHESSCPSYSRLMSFHLVTLK